MTGREQLGNKVSLFQELADFSFMGRTFMYGVSALGKKCGNHTIAMLKTQLTQVMEQMSCAEVKDLTKNII